MQTEIFEKYFIEMITLPVEEVCFLKVLNKTFIFFFHWNFLSNNVVKLLFKSLLLYINFTDFMGKKKPRARHVLFFS